MSARLIVDLDALRANYLDFAARSGPARTAAAIKADCYGLGMDRLAPVLRDAGCVDFFCASLSEGIAARRVLGNEPAIYVLNGVCADETPRFAEYRLVPVLNSTAQIQCWRENGRGAPAALHVDTGINRLGLPFEAFAPDLLTGINLVLVMSHLACGSEPSHPLNRTQCARFAAIQSALPGIPASLANSAGVLLGADWLFDMTRPGIGLYGGAPLDENSPQLQPVARLDVPVLHVRSLASGQSVGYGATFTATHPMRTATIALGYADGLLRSAAPKGFARHEGTKLPFLGRISMDMTVLDITDCPHTLAPGDTVSLLGSDLDALAKAAGTLSYEILTRLGPRLQRVYKEGPTR